MAREEKKESLPDESIVVESTTDTDEPVLHQGKNEGAEPSDSESSPPPKGLRFILLLTSVCMAGFVVALDRSIISTAIPSIAREFNSGEDIGWYGSAYSLTLCAFQPMFGRVYVHFAVRDTFLCCLAVFLVGSLLCAVTPSSAVLIAGRALAGLGCAGVIAGTYTTVSLSVPLIKRPIYIGIISSKYGIAFVCAPIVGGAFTSRVTWRWCFYMNLPVGAVTVVAVVTLFQARSRESKDAGLSFVRKLQYLDLVGVSLLVVSVTLLLLALQWAGTAVAWSSARTVGLLVGAGVGTVLFCGWQVFRGDQALVPLAIFNRTVVASIISSFFLSGANTVYLYYLPYWFQVVHLAGPIQSGVYLIPFIALNFICSIAAGVFISRTGYVNIPALIGVAIFAVGAGLLTIISISSNSWIGFEIVAGAGSGLAIQQYFVAVQASLPADIATIGNTSLLFAQGLAGAVFVSAANSILRNQLLTRLQGANSPQVNIEAVLATGTISEPLSATEAQQFFEIYNSAMQKVFLLAVPLIALGFLSTLPMRWLCLKKEKVDTADKEMNDEIATSKVEPRKND